MIDIVENQNIKVLLVLRNEQHIDYNRWKLTLNEEEVIVTDKRVQYCCETPVEAATSFKPEEVESVEISIKYA